MQDPTAMQVIQAAAGSLVSDRFKMFQVSSLLSDSFIMSCWQMLAECLQNAKIRQADHGGHAGPP